MQLTEILQTLGALIAGCLIGLAFGQLQYLAWRRNKSLAGQGRFSCAWAVMPGSFRRVAFLLAALILVQIVCPLLFVNGGQWWVSGGVVCGYGAVLWRQLRRSLTGGR